MFYILEENSLSSCTLPVPNLERVLPEPKIYTEVKHLHMEKKQKKVMTQALVHTNTLSASPQEVTEAGTHSGSTASCLALWLWLYIHYNSLLYSTT